MEKSHDDRVTIKFLRDYQTAAGSATYLKDSEYLVDPATADALVVAGIAVKIPRQQAE